MVGIETIAKFQFYPLFETISIFQQFQVYNEAVCNCHEDSVLLEVIGLVEKVYMAHTQKERCMYGQKLQRAIRTFLDDFVHHMEQVRIIFTVRNVLSTLRLTVESRRLTFFLNSVHYRKKQSFSHFQQIILTIQSWRQ